MTPHAFSEDQLCERPVSAVFEHVYERYPSVA